MSEFESYMEKVVTTVGESAREYILQNYPAFVSTLAT